MNTRTFRLLIIALILGFNFLLRLPFFDLPLERDEGEYAYIASVIAEGGLPYRDAFDQKPPAVFYLYRLIFALFGTDVRTLRLFVMFYNLITIFFVYRIGRLLKDGTFGLVAALIFSIMSSERRLLGFSANTEIFMLAPSVAGMYCLLARERVQEWPRCIAAGVLFGVAALFKQPAALTFAAALFIVAAEGMRERTPVAGILRPLLALCAGFAAPLALTAAHFAARGALGEFMDAVVLHNMNYVQPGFRTEEVLRNLLGTFAFFLQSQAFFWGLLLLGIVMLLRAGKKTRLSLVLPWFVCAAVGISLGRRFTLHYFLQWTPPFALIAAAGFCRLSALLPSLSKKPPAVHRGVFPLLILLIAALPVRANYRYFGRTPEQLAAAVYSANNPMVEAVTAGAYLKRHLPKDRRILVVGSEPQILFYSGCRSASRYIFFYPLTGAYPDTQVRQREVTECIAASPPEYILYVNYAASLGTTDRTEPYLFEQLNGLLKHSYELCGCIRPESPGTVCEGQTLYDLSSRGLEFYAARQVFIYRRIVEKNAPGGKRP